MATITTICLITSRITGEARRERYTELMSQLRAEYPAATFVTIDDERYLAPGARSTNKEVPGADAEFVKEGVRLGLDDLPEKFKKYVSVLHLRQVANARKHLDALRAVSAGGGSGLVLEDDAISGNGWEAIVRNAAEHVARLDAARAGGCMALLGIPAPDAPNGEPRDLLDVFELSPVCDSYIVGPAAARVLSSSFLPLRFRTNVHLSYLAEVSGTLTALFRPNAFCDGSKLGAYASTLNVNNRLLLSSDYMRARHLLESMQSMGSAEERIAAATAAKEIITGSPVKGNCDMLFLRAVVEAELGGNRAGKIAFSAAYASALRAGALVNNESELLSSMICLYGDVPSQGVVEPASRAFSDAGRVREKHLTRPVS